MIPLRDANPTPTPPHVTRIFIVINVAIFFLVWTSPILRPLFGVPLPSLFDAIQNYGMTPIYVLNGQRLYTIFTSMFLHGGLIHLLGNMLYLHIFGDNVEAAFGHLKYLVFYLICGVAATVTHLLSIRTVEGMLTPAVGASGAISGVLGAYFLLYPRARILTLVITYWVYIISVPALVFLGAWFIFQLFEGMLTFGLGFPSGVAYWAHIGGFLTGMLLTPIMKGTRTAHPAWKA